MPKKVSIIFAPDKNLGKYISKKAGRDLVLWDGRCIVHEAFSIDKLIELHKKYPDYKIIAHPESEEHILIQHNLKQLQSLMRDYAGIVRSNERLKTATKHLDLIYNEVEGPL